MSSADPPLESEPTIGAPVSRHLSVANLGRSIVFYRDMLGFDVRPLNEGEGGGAVAEALRGPARIQFTTQPGAFDSTDAARPRGSAMVFFQANDVAAMREFIVARGGTPRELEKVDFVPVSVEVRPHCSAQVPANTGSQTQTRVLDMDQ
jgi:predicted enzyme related to lactoylglutathione lyase